MPALNTRGKLGRHIWATANFTQLVSGIEAPISGGAGPPAPMPLSMSIWYELLHAGRSCLAISLVQNLP